MVHRLTSPILISGAGISGLALGQALLKASIPFRIFERDSSVSLRAQGYRFRIQSDGVKALAQLLPSEVYSLVEATCGYITPGIGPLAVLDALTAQDGPRPNFGGPGARPGGPPQPHGGKALNADRTVLRNVLLRGLEDYVSFDKVCESYEVTDSGITVHFSDGTSENGSLLVAADGAMSRIRRQFLPEHKLLDTEGRLIYGKTDLTPELETTLNEQILKGMTLLQDRSRNEDAPLSLVLEPMRFNSVDSYTELPANYLYWVLIMRKDVLGIDDATVSTMSNEAALDLSRKLTANWDASFQPLFDHQNKGQTSILRILSANPALPAWKSSNRVTLIGDAAHVMSPSAGFGATTAIRDSAALAEVIIKEVSNGAEEVSTEAIGEYEAQMRGWAIDAVKLSAMGGRFLFGMRDWENFESVNP